MAKPRVAVVGGGWAGLAAAIEAVEQKLQVSLFEMAPKLGGRARRVDVGGLALDNGQHILLGAYSDTFRLMRRVGIEVESAFLRTPLRIASADGHGLVLPAGPASLAFVRGVLGHSHWPLRARLALMRAAASWAARGFRCGDAVRVNDLTATLPSIVRDELVEPLCVAALNTPAAEASGRVFLRVMRDALFHGPGSSDLMLPRRDLGELLPEPALRWLVARGADVRLGTRVDQLVPDGNGWSVNGEAFDAVIMAASAAEAARLVRPTAAGWAKLATDLRHEPIVTIYAQCDEPRLPFPMLALPADTIASPAQFVFDHGQLGGPAGRLAFVVSAAGPWLDKGIDATERAALAQGRTCLAPYFRGELRLLRTLTEKRATFRCTAALQRPGARVAANLFAAGDYVDGPYPATLEGAVRSGLEAARSVSSISSRLSGATT